MTIRAVFLDAGETLIDEGRYWREVADEIEVPHHVVLAALGMTIARGEPHKALFGHLGMTPPAALEQIAFQRSDLYPDALPCLLALRSAGYRVGICGNQSLSFETWARSEQLPADVIGSSASWGVEKPAAGFFLRLLEEAGVPAAEVAYVGDRVDTDVVPAAEMGLVAIHIRRGPWGYLQPGAERAAERVESLAELLGVVARL